MALVEDAPETASLVILPTLHVASPVIEALLLSMETAEDAEYRARTAVQVTSLNAYPVLQA